MGGRWVVQTGEFSKLIDGDFFVFIEVVEKELFVQPIGEMGVLWLIVEFQNLSDLGAGLYGTVTHAYEGLPVAMLLLFKSVVRFLFAW